jgi:predicted CoA-binding protein
MSDTCELSLHDNEDPEITAILNSYGRIAVVGISSNPEKASNQVASYLIDAGYDVIPVNPFQEEVLGRKCYPDLTSIPGAIEIVDIFRRPDDVPPVVIEAIEIGAKVVWMQEGVVNNESADRALAAGLEVVMNKCIKLEHQRLMKN